MFVLGGVNHSEVHKLEFFQCGVMICDDLLPFTTRCAHVPFANNSLKTIRKGLRFGCHGKRQWSKIFECPKVIDTGCLIGILDVMVYEIITT